MTWTELSKKIAKQFEFVLTSHHESGHTIYALLHLMKVSSTSIFEDPQSKRILGDTFYDYPNDIDTVQDIELVGILTRADVGVSYAGLLTEKALFRTISGSSKTPVFISEGSKEDNKDARKVIKKYDLAPPGRKRSAYKQKLMREVRNELYTHWDAVSVIAHALFRHHKLTYDDLQALLTKKSKNKKFWKEQFKTINHFHENSKTLDEAQIKAMLSR